jgi:hypothetical protein
MILCGTLGDTSNTLVSNCNNKTRIVGTLNDFKNDLLQELNARKKKMRCPMKKLKCLQSCYEVVKIINIFT